MEVLLYLVGAYRVLPQEQNDRTSTVDSRGENFTDNVSAYQNTTESKHIKGDSAFFLIAILCTTTKIHDLSLCSILSAANCAGAGAGHQIMDYYYSIRWLF